MRHVKLVYSRACYTLDGSHNVALLPCTLSAKRRYCDLLLRCVKTHKPTLSWIRPQSPVLHAAFWPISLSNQWNTGEKLDARFSGLARLLEPIRKYCPWTKQGCWAIPNVEGGMLSLHEAFVTYELWVYCILPRFSTLLWSPTIPGQNRLAEVFFSFSQ